VLQLVFLEIELLEGVFDAEAEAAELVAAEVEVSELMVAKF
jgi:hypothetical protein